MKALFKKYAELVIVIALMGLTATCQGQINSTFKAAQSLRADSVQVRNYLIADSMANRETGWIYYNNQADKWRIGWYSLPDSVIHWEDLVTPGGAMDSVFAYNGLTAVDGDSVKLGGTLTENTTVTGAFSLTFNTTGAGTIISSKGGANGDIIITTQLAAVGDDIQINANDAASIAAGGAVLINSATMTATIAGTTTIQTTDGNISLNAQGATRDLGLAAADDMPIVVGDQINISADDILSSTVGTTIFSSAAAGDAITLDATVGNVVLDTDGAGSDVTITPVDDALVTAGDAIVLNGGTSTSILTISNPINTWSVPTAAGLTLQTGNTQWSIVSGGSGTVQDDTHTIVNGTRQTIYGTTGITTSGAGAALFTLSNNEAILIDATAGTNITIDTDAAGSDLLLTPAGALTVTAGETSNVTVSAGDLQLVSSAGNGILAAGLEATLSGGDIILTSTDDAFVNIGDDKTDAITGDWVLDAATIDVASTGVSTYTSAGNMNITATTSDDVNITGSDDVNIVSEGDDIVLSAAGDLSLLSVGSVNLTRTITAGGTTGNQTINKPAGCVNFAGGASTLTVTNSLSTTSSIIWGTVSTNDATATLKNIAPGAGSFVITLTAAATGETKFCWVLTN